ncbi:MAG: homoserine O-acetyltransferase MetX [Planctomycetota bacterium]|jgi:homoserine O-acetyltransferase
MEDKFKQSVGIVQTQTVRVVGPDAPLRLKCGKELGPIDVAYETYGRLNEQKDNAVLICHALSGNAHEAGYHIAEDAKPGWWDEMIGPGKFVDTNKYFVVCSNFLGGCSGTTGPSDVNPATGKPYGLDFPIITIEDTVRVQKLLLEKLGVDHLLAVIGGSMGGMQVLQWSIMYPDFVDAAVCAASTVRLNAQSIAFDAVGRNAILADPNFDNGQYHDHELPTRGLAIARMIGHITYLSEESMRKKFGRQLREAGTYNYDFNSEFSVETYLDYQGQTFIERFDANCYLYISKAMDYFDLEQEYGTLRDAFAGSRCRFLVVSFSSDWLFTPRQSEEIVEALAEGGKDVSYCNIYSPYGHDAFLLEAQTLGELIEGFVDSTWRQIRTDQKVRRGPGFRPPSTDSLDHAKRVRVDYQLIDSLITPNSRVLDLGCGDGELLSRLIQDKNVSAEGIELDEQRVVHCVGCGLPVVHRDIERGLAMYPDKAFDYAILSQTIQTLRHPQKVLLELHRIAEKVIVSFPNFGYWLCRAQLMFQGLSPRTKQLPFRWHDSPNVHFLSLKDYDSFCRELSIRVEQRIPLGKKTAQPLRILPNLLASQAVYVTSKSEATA